MSRCAVWSGWSLTCPGGSARWAPCWGFSPGNRIELGVRVREEPGRRGSGLAPPQPRRRGEHAAQPGLRSLGHPRVIDPAVVSEAKKIGVAGIRD